MYKGGVFISRFPCPMLLLCFAFSKSSWPTITGSKETASSSNLLLLLRLRKNVAMKMTKTRPKMATAVNTKPDVTLFCRKAVLVAVGGDIEGIEDDSTTTVACSGTEGVELELLSVEEVEEVEEVVDEVKEGKGIIPDATPAEPTKGVKLDDGRVELVGVPLDLVLVPSSRESRNPGRKALGRIPSKG